MEQSSPYQIPSSGRNITFALPTFGDHSDSESFGSGNSSETYLPRPVRPLFSAGDGTETTPRMLEEGHFPSHQSSSSTLRKTPQNPHTSAPLIPDRHPQHGGSSGPIPAKKGGRWYRNLRWNFGSVYRRIFCLAYAGNMITLVILIARSLLGTGPTFTYQTAATAVSANLLAALIARNEHFVNALFWVFGSWPKNFPLWARRLFAKVYSYGGIHSGGGVAATFWYIAFLVLFTLDTAAPQASSWVLRGFILAVSYLIIVCLITILVFAHPRLRVKLHDSFELTHRFLGWTAILLFWAQTLLLAADSAARSTSTTLGAAVVSSPSFWMLIVITLLVVYPWTRLRLRNVKATVLSQHCVKLDFDYRDVHYGQAVRLTDNPLKETHAFAVIPNPAAPQPEPEVRVVHCPGCRCGAESSAASSSSTLSLTSKPLPQIPSKSAAQTLLPAGKKGFSVLVSNAGDWTQKMIRNPPTQLYTRGTPQFGVLRVAGLFSPCLVMATGSGIGPCLSLFVQRPDHPVRIIWSAKSPVETYGQAVIDLLYETDPGAVIIDTKKDGRPDLVNIAYRVWEGSRRGERGVEGEGKKVAGPCEAVVIISNQKVTRKVVYGLESRGVPAYGAIFDS